MMPVMARKAPTPAAATFLPVDAESALAAAHTLSSLHPAAAARTPASSCSVGRRPFCHIEVAAMALANPMAARHRVGVTVPSTTAPWRQI
ncbi:hypothetical protein BDA96_10G164100 [Sorghum bicolor]|nr:hypothetical protein BDA96_10G164100 [Sorghum bicolor]